MKSAFAVLLFVSGCSGIRVAILVFRETDEGDVAPMRVLKGPRTGLSNPTGLFVDTKNNELFVSNMGNHSATVYPRDANGDVAPLRTIRIQRNGSRGSGVGGRGRRCHKLG